MGINTKPARHYHVLPRRRAHREKMKGKDGRARVEEEEGGGDDGEARFIHPYLGQVEKSRGTLERVRQHPGAGEQQTAGVGHGAQRGVTGRFAH